MNKQSTGLVKHSLCKAEEGWIKNDSRGHVLMAVSKIGTLTNIETHLVGPGKVCKAETRQEASHVPGKESRDSCRLKEQLKSLRGVEITYHLLENSVEESGRT